MTPSYCFFVLLVPVLMAVKPNKCRDTDMNCATWIASNRSSCDESGLVMEHCPRMCQTCGEVVDPRYDIRRLPSELQSIAWMVGRWRSEFGGKAFFPTIPKFTYGEQIDITIGDLSSKKKPALNYTAFAWDLSVPEDELIELHSENGYLVVSKDEKTQKEVVSLTTAMSNGFMTVEEAEPGPNQIRFKLARIGRISFSHDSAVRMMFREWTLLDEERFESRLLMATTVTRRLMEHTAIIYKKIYPR
uniref:ShKT domain-containing protein n=1 Tax=Haemonchus contortus TaxID=6289 RepID=A0A7I4Y9U9_HAECO